MTRYTAPVRGSSSWHHPAQVALVRPDQQPVRRVPDQVELARHGAPPAHVRRSRRSRSACTGRCRRRPRSPRRARVPSRIGSEVQRRAELDRLAARTEATPRARSRLGLCSSAVVCPPAWSSSATSRRGRCGSGSAVSRPVPASSTPGLAAADEHPHPGRADPGLAVQPVARPGGGGPVRAGFGAGRTCAPSARSAACGGRAGPAGVHGQVRGAGGDQHAGQRRWSSDDGTGDGAPGSGRPELSRSATMPSVVCAIRLRCQPSPPVSGRRRTPAFRAGWRRRTGGRWPGPGPPRTADPATRRRGP